MPTLVGQFTTGLALNAKLGDAADKSAKTAQAQTRADQGRLGLALRPLVPQERRDAGVESGLLVEDARGPAALAGVQQGDVLLSIDNVSLSFGGLQVLVN